MQLRKERIEQVKDIALANLKRADNSRGDLDKEKYWSLYRADVRELLSIVKSLEEERDK
jgi:cytidylate kinase|tara:strand:- start:108 stop:284 length:177 start_codon:yes stop_codon:yes gene_type:complete